MNAYEDTQFSCTADTITRWAGQMDELDNVQFVLAENFQMYVSGTTEMPVLGTIHVHYRQTLGQGYVRIADDFGKILFDWEQCYGTPRNHARSRIQRWVLSEAVNPDDLAYELACIIKAAKANPDLEVPGKIQAIKCLRQYTDVGPKKGKDLIEKYAA